MMPASRAAIDNLIKKTIIWKIDKWTAVNIMFIGFSFMYAIHLDHKILQSLSFLI